jgi:hypothetical protein
MALTPADRLPVPTEGSRVFADPLECKLRGTTRPGRAGRDAVKRGPIRSADYRRVEAGRGGQGGRRFLSSGRGFGSVLPLEEGLGGMLRSEARELRQLRE